MLYETYDMFGPDHEFFKKDVGKALSGEVMDCSLKFWENGIFPQLYKCGRRDPHYFAFLDSL